MKVMVLINAAAGMAHGESRTLEQSVGLALENANIEFEVQSIPGDLLVEAARSAAEHFDVVVAGGGDGTINAVATALAGSDTPLGVLPLGTLNHFAKDLGIPLELGAAAQALTTGKVARIDVGQLNDRIFINNSSLGVYARALVDRDARRERHGLAKWPAMALAVLKIFRRSPLLHVQLNTPAGLTVRKTPLVFVGNNRYLLEVLRVGKRDRLDRGELSLYIMNTTTRWGMLKLALRMALGRLEQSRDFEAVSLTEVTVEMRRRQTMHVALDGELAIMALPLKFRIWPGALRVLAPGDSETHSELVPAASSTR